MSRLEEEFNINDELEEIQRDPNIDSDIKESMSNAVATLNDTKLQLSELKEQKFNIADREYLATQLQDLINTNMIVLQGLAPMCRVGAPPAVFMSFTSISNTVTANLKELFALNKQITDYQVTEAAMAQKQHNFERKMKQNKEQLQPQQATNIQNNYILSPSEKIKALAESGVETKKYEMPDFKF